MLGTILIILIIEIYFYYNIKINIGGAKRISIRNKHGSLSDIRSLPVLIYQILIYMIDYICNIVNAM